MPSTVFPQFGIRKIIVGLPQREIQEDVWGCHSSIVNVGTGFVSRVVDNDTRTQLKCPNYQVLLRLLFNQTGLYSLFFHA